MGSNKCTSACKTEARCSCRKNGISCSNHCHPQHACTNREVTEPSSRVSSSIDAICDMTLYNLSCDVTSGQAQLLYDFVGEADSELTLNEGSVISIIDKDRDDGWFEAVTSDGKKGFVPRDYVQVWNAGNALPAPGFNNQASSVYPPPASLNIQASVSPDEGDSWDSDEEVAEHGTIGGHRQQKDGDASRPNRASSAVISLNKVMQGKHGLDSFLLGKNCPITAESIVIQVGEGGPRWEVSTPRLYCIVASPKKSNKLYGMKSFIEYQLTPSDSLVSVFRRYKHFDWLYERLVAKFGAVALVPPLPDKQVAGRFEDEFIQLRMERLQAWMYRVCSHPLLGSSQVFKHFLHACNEKEWKDGKRKAEKDEAVGAGVFASISTSNPTQSNDLDDMERNIDKFTRFVRSMEEVVKHLLSCGQAHYRHCATELPKDYQGMGKAIKDLSTTFAMIEIQSENSLINAMSFMGTTYDDIGELIASQMKSDVRIFLDGQQEYRGMLACFPAILSLQKSAVDKVKDCDRFLQANKLLSSEKAGIMHRGLYNGTGTGS
uniref:sorting nexin-9-like n=1 Tax=Myxine glutinosa TaxID=7769 RepID=UPI00358ED15F